MIDLSLYRFRVGVYHGKSINRCPKQLKTGKTGGIFNLDSFNQDFFIICFFNIFKFCPALGLSSRTILLYLFCVLYMIYVVTSSLLMACVSINARPSYDFNCLGGGPNNAYGYERGQTNVTYF